MKRLGLALLVALVALLALPAAAQKKVTWTARLIPADARAGEGAQIVLVAKLTAPWHMYSLTQPDGGPLKTTLQLLPGSALAAAGKGVQPKPKTDFDQGFKINVEIFEGTVAFGLPVTIAKNASGAQTAKVKVRYQLCNASTCLPPEKEEIAVSFTVAKGAARPNRLKAVTTVPKAAATRASLESPHAAALLLTPSRPKSQPPQPPAPSASGASADTSQQITDALQRGILPFLLISFGAGLLALITPCVFPMIPITVSFFTKRKAGERGGGIAGATVYCVGIMSAFMVAGLGVSLVIGPNFVSKFGTNPYVNLVFAVLFILLGLNLLGVYEIRVPAGLAGNLQSKGAQKGGYAQPFLMGFAFALTSFTCTAPYVGTMLAAGAQFSLLHRFLGMLTFSLAFAAPFFFLALFPQRLAAMPKSGSWLVTVKAFMGMLELAAAVKFLSNADIVWQKEWLTRPVFLAIWATIGFIAGLYLLGWLRLPHDLDGSIGWTRRAVGVGTLAVAVYMLAAMQGASLGFFEAFPPPPGYGQGQAMTVAANNGAGNASAAPIVWLEKYEEGLAKAKAENKPLLVNFTGVTCTNCRQNEQNVFPRPEVQEEFRNFVLVELYTDKLANDAQEAESERNKQLQQKLAGTIELPLYIVMTPDGKVIKKTGGLQQVEPFVAFLKEGRTQTVASLK
jgi:thiol:disulfide interchange protein DsbD